MFLLFTNLNFVLQIQKKEIVIVSLQYKELNHISIL